VPETAVCLSLTDILQIRLALEQSRRPDLKSSGTTIFLGCRSGPVSLMTRVSGCRARSVGIGSIDGGVLLRGRQPTKTWMSLCAARELPKKQAALCI
jgi:hypothetical protein